MINQLCCFSQFQRIFSIICYGLIAIIICFCLVKLLKTDGGKQLLFYIISGVLIVVAIVCGIMLYKKITSKSYINGQIDISNQFVSQTFEYKSSSVVFTKNGDSDVYSYEIDLTKLEDFNGANKQYEVKLNDYVLFNSTITSGSVSTNLEINFYDTKNNNVCSANLQILVEFLSNKSRLKFSTEGSKQAEFLTQYFTDYGVRLSILELKGDKQ